MHRPNIKVFNKKADQITSATRTFFGEKVPDYVRKLPSIKKDSKRWIFNILYFVVGLMYNWAVSVVLRQMPSMSKFPSNVAGMIVLIFVLLSSHAIFPKYTDRIVQIINPYSSFALRSMSVMFAPNVVQIVNNPPTSGPEIGRMICVFFVTYIIGFILCTLVVRFLRLVLFSPIFSSKKEKSNTLSNESNHFQRNPTLKEEEIVVDIPNTETINEDSSAVSIEMSSKRLSNIASFTSTLDGVSAIHVRSNVSAENSTNVDHSPNNHIYEPVEKHGPLHYFAVWCMQQSSFDDLTLFITFCLCAFVFLPLPEDNPAMPFFRLFLYFTMTVLSFSAACRLPARVKMIFNPIIVTAATVMAGIAYFERVKGFDIKHGVLLYKSGINFIGLVEKTKVGWPGGGDILADAMDVSVISLAFNVYNSRPGSIREWFIIFMTIIPMAFLIMFITPLFAYTIGCTPGDSLVWSARAVTTPIGISIAKVLDANASIITCLIVFTGVMGPVTGAYLYRLSRVKEDDYLTIGVTMGCSSHGVGTAYLISKNSPASGTSSITFAIFGTIGVIVATIPALSDIIKRFSGY